MLFWVNSVENIITSHPHSAVYLKKSSNVNDRDYSQTRSLKYIVIGQKQI